MPDGAFRAQLRRHHQRRALLELATVHTWTHHLPHPEQGREDGRPPDVHRGASGGRRRRRSAAVAYLTVRPLRGYAKQASRLAAYLAAQSGNHPDKHDSYFWALRGCRAHAGRTFGQAGCPPTARHDGRRGNRGHPAPIAGRRCGPTKQVSKPTSTSEYLHDFRIAVRRTRSALSQIRKVFPPDNRRLQAGVQSAGSADQ